MIDRIRSAWDWVMRPDSGPIGAANDWVVSRKTEIASWWTHERVTQTTTIFAMAVGDFFGSLGVAVDAGDGATAAAAVVMLYFFREAIPAVLGRRASALDRTMDWFSALWGFASGALIWIGLTA